MNAVPFDTSKLARGLEAAGLAGPVAAGTATAPAEAMGGADPATKTDLAMTESRIVGTIGALDTKIMGAIGALDTKFDTKFASLDAKFDAKLELLRRDMTTKLGGMSFVATGVLLAAMRRMTPAWPHP